MAKKIKQIEIEVPKRTEIPGGKIYIPIPGNKELHYLCDNCGHQNILMGFQNETKEHSCIKCKTIRVCDFKIDNNFEINTLVHELELEQLIDEYKSLSNETYTLDNLEFSQYLFNRIQKMMIKHPSLRTQIKKVKFKRAKIKKRDKIIIILIVILIFLWMVLSL